jgi:hypothetical protein
VGNSQRFGGKGSNRIDVRDDEGRLFFLDRFPVGFDLLDKRFEALMRKKMVRRPPVPRRISRRVERQTVEFNDIKAGFLELRT